MRFLPGAAMATKGYRHIPHTLFDAITFLVQVLPNHAVPTWFGLLFGAKPVAELAVAGEIGTVTLDSLTSAICSYQ
jgi:hypothetical protein